MKAHLRRLSPPAFPKKCHAPKVGSGFCPVFLRTATSRTRCLPLPKGEHNFPHGLHREIPADRENSWVKMCFPCNLDPFGKWSIYPCFWGVFRHVCGFQRRGGILTLPQRRKGRTGATVGFTVFTVGVVSVLQVYFQLQTEKSIVPQRFSGFRFSTAEEAEQYHCYTSVAAL